MIEARQDSGEIMEPISSARTSIGARGSLQLLRGVDPFERGREVTCNVGLATGRTLRLDPITTDLGGLGSSMIGVIWVFFTLRERH